MVLFRALKKCISHCLAFGLPIVSIAFSSVTYAAPALTEFGVTRDNCSEIPLTPIRMMDNETLFLSAAAEKDSSMSLSQKLANNRWLANTHGNNYSGTEALRKFLKLSVDSYWNATGHTSKKPYRVTRFSSPKRSAYTQFTELRNYDLHLSENKVKVKFSYAF
ncbi:hypothetical protein [Teredinibacter sp. KSP-S5-2]|uniref:hypothetical protein n=1 Tax=Teredinibacter sp. KSP-S5-2 TaxID=3034506 RepID=UPI0029347B98|nr:hypothetical protein [Teredinibacter sp. KSP-S5-2]WNO11094.1 hypothetical protein P5V12_07910 [Teredinibacter sp. KSP-S5-2]